MAGNLTAMIASIFSGGVTPDPYYEYTTLLLPGNGTNGAQNNTFLDGSTNNFTITRNGNTTQGTFSPFSQTGWGNYLSGSSQYLSISSPPTNLREWWTTDFTIEAWIYPLNATNLQNTNAAPTMCGNCDTAGYDYWSFGPINSGVVRFKYYNGGTVNVDSTQTITINQWNHVAMTKTSSGITIFVNGVASSTTAVSGTPQAPVTVPFTIGANYTTSINAHISNLRAVKGRAVYTSNYTPPTSPLTRTTGGQNPPQGTECSLLTCQSNRFLDSNGVNTPASSPLTITPNGSPSVQAFSPFNPTASWSAATYGGSGYFDGSGDSLSVASNTALQLTGEFTMEAWYYPVGFPGAGVFDSLIATGDNATSSNAIAIYISSSGGIQLYNHVTSTAIFNTASGVVLNAWNHIAATRNSSNGVDLWLNGVSQGSTVTVSSSFTSTTPTRIGTSSINQDCYGYISNARIVKGTAVYTSAFTPPTAPLTAITNTSLLLNFTNAGIYDATSKNDLETVGNAQISTAISAKWGGSSISFDGTGDWLLIPDQPPQRIGTGNFTIEMWVYRNSSGTYGLAGKGTGTTGWLVSLNSSNQVVFTYGSSTITSSGTVSATTWTHIAVVREGTSTNQTKIYIGGTNDGTGTVSTDFNQTNSMYIGADRTGGSAANAYVQDVRITNYARYTANFTAPTAAFPTL